MEFKPDSLYYGDCLDVMRQWPAECVDLCYLDPPFNSNSDYNILFGREARSLAGEAGEEGFAQLVAFEDTWQWDDAAQNRVDLIERAVAHPAHAAIAGIRTMLGECGMLAYLSYMAERLCEIKRVLKPEGSVYLHCDPSASHYLKAVMDAIFGGRYFRSEIVWKRSHSHNSAKRYGPIHDVILFYTKSDKYVWRDVRQPYDPAYVERYFKFDDEDGRGPYWTGDITGSGVRNGKTGMSWRGFNPTAKKCHWMVAPSELDRMDADGRVYWPRTQGAWPKVKRFLSEAKGIPLQDLIVDIWGLSTMGGPKSERLGYPTQKPLALMKRIIEASSREGDVVLDPFCGCGTTVAAARDSKRRFVGIDVSHFAIDLVRERRLKDRSVPINGVPVDMHTAGRLAKDDPLEFEKWAVTRVPGMVPNATQIGDRGIDGRGKLLDGGLVLAQVKGGKFALGQFRDFLHVVGREDATCGIFTTLRPVQSPNAKREASEAGYLQLGANRYPKTQFWSIADYFQDRLPILPPLADPYTGKAMQRDILAG